MTDSRYALHRARLGSFGESVAALLLMRHGVQILDRNVSVGRGELDLIAVEASDRFAVEVKTAVASPTDHPPQPLHGAQVTTSRRAGRGHITSTG